MKSLRGFRWWEFLRTGDVICPISNSYYQVKLLKLALRVNPEHVLVVVELLEGCICLTNYTYPQEKATTL